MRIRLALTLVLIGLLAVLSGSRPAAADGFPTGVYTMEMGSDEWELSFDKTGHYTATRAGATRAEGTYKVTQNNIELKDTKGPKAHTGDARSGTYSWTWQDDQLVFTLVSDIAEGRPEILTFQPWRLKH